jgi:catechol 2,3-dioxygenase-like lactoylglutathione lyase family enzyme
MVRTRAVPLLPAGSLDASIDFYAALGFTVVVRQERPNPYAALQRDDLDLHLYGMPDWDPDASHSTCLVVTPDPQALWDAWAAGLRERYGRLPVAGLPRITRPRRRVNAEGSTGFSVVDPAGNWIRVFRDQQVPSGDAVAGPLARAIDNAVVTADSRGEPAQALKVLLGALRRNDEAQPAERAPALALVAELQIRTGDPDGARATLADLDRLDGVEGTTTDVADLRANL